MNCTCIQDIEKKLAAFIAPRAGEGATASIMNTALAIPDEGPVYAVLNVPFRVKGSKKGFTSERGKEVTMQASYCPFCARSAKHYSVGEDAGIAAAMGVQP